MADPQATPSPAPATGQAKSKTNGKSHLLSVTDPEGYEIALSLDTWEKHILRNHPEMKEHLDSLSSTLSDPQVIYRAETQFETHYYYRLTGRSLRKVQDVYLNAVVHRTEETKKGFVKTAFLLKRLRKEGTLVWINKRTI
jgi:hypothetical protein